MKDKKVFYLVILGIAIGALSFFSTGTVFILLLASLAYFAIHCFSGADERNFLKAVFITGFALRAMFSLFQDGAVLIFVPSAVIGEVENPSPINDSYYNLIHENTRSFLKMSDSDYVSARGYIYSAVAKGMDNVVTRHYIKVGWDYGWHGYLYIVGSFYYLFGYSPIAVKFINCLLGALLAIAAYAIGNNFSKNIGRISILLVMFFPSLFLWSTTNLKDTFLSLSAVVLLWLVIRFLKTKKLSFLAGIAMCIFVQGSFTKRDLWLLSMGIIIFTGLFILFLMLKKKWLLAWVFAIFIILNPLNLRDTLHAEARSTLYRLYVIHCGFITTPGVNYRILDEKYYLNQDLLYNIPFLEVIKSIGRAIFHFMFEPLPGRILGSSSSIALPQMLIWYFLIPFMLLGVLRGIRLNYLTAVPILIYSFLFAFSLSLFSGNVGTVFRHRDMLTSFFLILSAIGLDSFFKLKGEKTHESIF